LTESKLTETSLREGVGARSGVGEGLEEGTGDAALVVDCSFSFWSSASVSLVWIGEPLRFPVANIEVWRLIPNSFILSSMRAWPMRPRSSRPLDAGFFVASTIVLSTAVFGCSNGASRMLSPASKADRMPSAIGVEFSLFDSIDN